MSHLNAMNILLIAPQPFFQERGTPIAVKLLAESIASFGHNIHLLVYHEGDDVEIANVTLHRTLQIPFIRNIKPGLSLKKIICDLFIFFRCIQLIRTHRIHIIHAVEEGSFIALFFKWVCNIPYVYDMDSLMSQQIIDKFPRLKFLHRPMLHLEKIVTLNSIGVVAVCKSLEDIARNFSPTKEIVRLEDITLLDQNVDGKEILKDRFSIHGTTIMYVGNFENYQGIELLLNAFQILTKKNQPTSLLLIGGTPNDIDHYQNMAKQLKISDNTFFCGPRPLSHLAYYLAQADILVSPRTQGGNTPMKIYSYLDSGKPLVATNLHTHTQVLDEEISVLVEPTPIAFGQGLYEIIREPIRQKQIGNNARKRVQQKYSLSAYKNKLQKFYRKIEQIVSGNTYD